MYYSLNNTDSNHNIVNYLHGRENHLSGGKLLQQNFQFTAPLLKRLSLEYQLDGHSGCVNCLEWSSNGRLLASGSDDTHVRIWDPFNHKCLNVISTTHIGNIFSVKFLGDESLIATGAGDCRVLVRSIDDSRTSAPHVTCTCHCGRIKRLAKAPDQPLLFWSASEDGLVIQYDLREPHECMVKSTIFIELTAIDLKCISVNPTQPHLIAIGANDCYARLYDRRMVRTARFKHNTLENPKRDLPVPQESNCVQYYAPGHLAKDINDYSNKLAATYLTFNSSGTELLVNMGGEHIYLYDLNKPRHINELMSPDTLFGNYKNGDCLCYDLEMNVNIDVSNLPNRSSANFDYIRKAEKLVQRNWIGDVYLAARHYFHAIQQRPNDKKVFMSFIECLVELKWYNEAKNWLNLFQKRFPYEDCQEILANMQMCYRCDEDKNSEPPFFMTRQEKELRADSRDFELRFVGHCNTTTDIKEVNYLGESGNFICAGSDDGLIFIWDRKTTEVVTALRGDASIVNCVQPHPSACYLASSGIDPCIRLWSPANEDGTVNPYIIVDPTTAIEANQRRMAMDPFETMLENVGYRVRDDGYPPRISQQMCRTS